MVIIVGHLLAKLENYYQCTLHDTLHTTVKMLTAYTNPTNYNVRRDLLPQISPHLLYNLLTSSMDNLMMAHLQGRNM